MHLVVPGAVGHFYNLQKSLTAAHHVHQATAYVTKGFHSDLHFWRRLCADMPKRPTYLAEILQRLPQTSALQTLRAWGQGRSG